MKLTDEPMTPDLSALPVDEQEFIKDLAKGLIEMLDAAEKAIAERLSNERLEQEEMLAVWSLLPSKVRTAIKRSGQ